MKKRNVFALSTFAIFYISFGILLTLNQERVIYQPFPQDFDSCNRLAEAERITFKGTRMYAYETDKPTAVLYHGNAGSACDRELYAHLLTQAGYGYMIVEYAGYSNDSRTPTHALIKNDVTNVIEYIESENIADIAIIGESIGTGVAAYHASLRAPEKMILVSPFTDLHDIARNRFWFYPTSLLVNNAFDNETALQNYRNEVLFIHGDTDLLIPHELGKKLFESLSAEKKFITIEGAGHNDLFSYQQTYDAILEFLQQE